MGQLDVAMKAVVERWPRDLLALALPALRDLPLDPLPAELTAPERRADIVFRVREPEDNDWIVHAEFQYDLEADLPLRLFTYNARLYERHRLPVLSVLYGLRPWPRPPDQRHDVVLACYGIHIHHFEYRFVNLADMAPRQLYEAAGIGLLPLVPLCRHCDLADIGQAAERLQSSEPDPQRLADGLSVLALLATRRFAPADIWRLVRRELMTESPLYYEILNEGIVKGRAEGIEKGIEQGRAEALRTMLVHILVRRLGPLTPEQHQSLAQCKNPDELQALLSAAFDLTDPQALSRLMFGRL